MPFLRSDTDTVLWIQCYFAVLDIAPAINPQPATNTGLDIHQLTIKSVAMSPQMTKTSGATLMNIKWHFISLAFWSLVFDTVHVLRLWFTFKIQWVFCGVKYVWLSVMCPVYISVQDYDLICNVKCRHGVYVLQKPPSPSPVATHNNSCSESVGSGLASKVMLRFSDQLEVYLIILLFWLLTWLSVACGSSDHLDFLPSINITISDKWWHNDCGQVKSTFSWEDIVWLSFETFYTNVSI